MTAVCSPECEGSIRHYKRFLVTEFIGLFDPESAFYSEEVCFTQYANSPNYKHWLTKYPHAVPKFVQRIRCTVSERRITGANCLQWNTLGRPARPYTTPSTTDRMIRPNSQNSTHVLTVRLCPMSKFRKVLQNNAVNRPGKNVFTHLHKLKSPKQRELPVAFASKNVLSSLHTVRVCVVTLASFQNDRFLR